MATAVLLRTTICSNNSARTLNCFTAAHDMFGACCGRAIAMLSRKDGSDLVESGWLCSDSHSPCPLKTAESLFVDTLCIVSCERRV